MTPEAALTAELGESRAKLSPAQGEAVATLIRTMKTADALTLVRSNRGLSEMHIDNRNTTNA